MTTDPVEQKEWAEGLLRNATPGPWWATDDLDGGDDPAVGVAFGMPSDDGSPYTMVAMTPGSASFDPGDPADKEANAALIAAAPDLAAAVISLAGEVERLTAENERHRNANLVRAVLDGWDEAVDGTLAEYIASEGWSAVPWKIAERSLTAAAALSPHPSERKGP